MCIVCVQMTSSALDNGKDIFVTYYHQVESIILAHGVIFSRGCVSHVIQAEVYVSIHIALSLMWANTWEHYDLNVVHFVHLDYHAEL